MLDARYRPIISDQPSTALSVAGDKVGIDILSVVIEQFSEVVVLVSLLPESTFVFDSHTAYFSLELLNSVDYFLGTLRRLLC